MPKMKSIRGAVKRFKKKAGGKVKFTRAFRRHILTKKSSDQKRRLRREGVFLKSCDAKLAKRMLRGG